MTEKNLTEKNYSALLFELKKVFIEGLEKIEQEKVLVYWRTGQLISQHMLENRERADYGKNLLGNLSQDLGIDIKTLQRTVRFYRVFPTSSALTKLSWLHYLQLITVKDEEKRAELVEKAVKKEWGYRALEEAIRLDRLTVEEPEQKFKKIVKKFNTTRARLYSYQVLEPSYIHPIEERFIVDLGFSVLIHVEMRGLRLKAGELIESQKSGTAYSFKHSDAKPRELYAYKALVERVIDADTIWLNIDLGFDCWTRQKVRLRAIDAPELTTKEGSESKIFVEARLKETSFVVIKTYKSDKYDRYLSDVFYLKDEKDEQIVLSQGTFLNQELLNLGLAQLMSSD